DATVRFEIAYSDGDSLTSSERFKKEGGGWKHSLANTHLKLAEKSGGPMPIPPPQQAAKDVVLEKEYATIPTSDVSLRLPAGSKLDPNVGAAFQPGLDLRINVTTGPGIGLESASEEMAKLWKQPGHSLADKRDVTLGKVKGVIFEGTATLN